MGSFQETYIDPSTLTGVLDLIASGRLYWLCYKSNWFLIAPFFFQFANHLFILIVGLSYSALAPIITPFVAMYFGFGYVVWMHQTLSIYMPVYTNGGMMWPRVFNR